MVTKSRIKEECEKRKIKINAEEKI